MTNLNPPKLSKKERIAANLQRLKETGSYCAKTNLKASDGKEDLQTINDRINKAKSVTEIFLDMKTLMTSVAVAKGYIKKGQCKIRKGGTPDDFLNYCTMRVCERWKKQGDILTAAVGQTKIDNWCAYGQIVMFSYLAEYNRSIFDLDFSQVPLQIDDDDEVSEIQLEDTSSEIDFKSIVVRQNFSKETIYRAASKLPRDLQIYLVDILYYITYNKFLDQSKKTFAIVGTNFLRGILQDELGD